jgi:hypothetical protein
VKYVKDVVLLLLVVLLLPVWMVAGWAILVYMMGRGLYLRVRSATAG